ncbi:hypothetical protein LG734_005229 [Salmonella enterica subsp. enterica serovar Java]|nr:hypothetical protein [Salmonella enterica subsp. enterica serovar Java]
MANFSTVVELYRASSRPRFDGRSFSTTVVLDDTLSFIIKSLLNGNKGNGCFEDIEIDGEMFDEDDIENIQSNIRIGKKFTYTFITPKNGAERFYRSLEDFLSINTLKKGILPNNYYIAYNDFYSLDDDRPSIIDKIEKICSIITLLSEIAHYHDTKSESSNYRLVFVKNSDSKSTSVALETCITEKMLQIDDINDDVLKTLLSPEDSASPHHLEKIGIFRNTIVEYTIEKNLNFEMLICNWPLFLKLYNNNLSTYMSGFSFHKARKDIATAEAEFAEKISKIITELTGKILSIPVSLLASIGIFKLNSTPEMSLVLSGVVLTSFLLHMVLVNQEKQLNIVTHAKDLAFKSFIKNSTSYPKELNDDIQIAIKELTKNQKTIRLFMYLTWLPSSIAFAIFLSRFFI